MSHNVAAHQPWCDPAQHATGSPSCLSASLNIEAHGISSFLQHTEDGTQAAVFVGAMVVLVEPAALHPLAMALLAHHNTLTGDHVAAEYYRHAATQAGA